MSLVHPLRVSFDGSFKNLIVGQLFAFEGSEAERRAHSTEMYRAPSYEEMLRWLDDFVARGPMPANRKRRAGAGRKPVLSDEEENELRSWILERRAAGDKVTPKAARTEARRRFPARGKFQRRWQAGFLRRTLLHVYRGFSLVRTAADETTLTTAAIAAKHCREARAFFQTFYACLKRRGFENSPRRVAVGDEMSIAFETHSKTGCIDVANAERVRVRCTPLADYRSVTVFDAMLADGSKLPLFVTLAGEEQQIEV
jgi:hypothetical protein